MKRLMVVAAGAIVLLSAGAVWLVWRGSSSQDEAVRAAYREYDAACRVGDLAAARGRAAGARAAELARPAEGEMFAGAGRARPTLARIAACRVSGDTATLRLRGSKDGSRAAGTATLQRAEDGWKVAAEEWTVHADPPAPAEDPAPALQPLLDQLASEDPMEAAKAWLEIGARYRSAAAFLSEARPALWDRRPVRFQMAEGTFAGKEASFRYFTAKTPAETGPVVPADTVGETLRYHLWQYEDVSHSGFAGTFDEWWDGYAPSRGLPGGGPP